MLFRFRGARKNFFGFRSLNMEKTDKIQHLRDLMKQKGLNAYVVPSEDSHQSEYIRECDARRAFISGFTGLNF